jgi:hypothetical protein
VTGGCSAFDQPVFPGVEAGYSAERERQPSGRLVRVAALLWFWSTQIEEIIDL